MSKLSSENRSLFEIGSCLGELSKSLEVNLSEALSEYGAGLCLFTINSISTDDNDPSVVQLKKALVKRAEMNIVGYSYIQERSFDTMLSAAGNAGTAGAMMGAGMGLGMGAGVGIPMGQAMSEVAKSINPAGNRFCCHCGAALPTGAKFCSSCGEKIE